jgi:hypothetical protein
MKKVNILLLIIILFSGLSFAQYQTGKNTAGAVLGFGGGGLDGDGAIPIGLEYNFYNLHPNIQAGVYGAWASTHKDYSPYGKWNYTYFVLAGQANYHFIIPSAKEVDPFVGLSLGYNFGSVSWEGNGTWGNPDAGGFFFSAQAGLNYWFSPKWAVQARFGYFPYFGVGVTAAL